MVRINSDKSMSVKYKLFGNIDFSQIKDDPYFLEDRVREDIVLPILDSLGYERENVIRSLRLSHPFYKTGSKRDRVDLIPDFVMKVENNYAWVLDAKNPREKIVNDDNVTQVYSYASHIEIQSTFFALCNGLEFAVYRTVSRDSIPILFFKLDEIDYYYDSLKKILSPNCFQLGKKVVYESKNNNQFDYLTRSLPKEIVVHKQAVKRHNGVHGYFTRQSWDIVQTYIKNFSVPGDVVLDPYGGSGVTAIEAMMLNRKGINVDINPMAIFIVKALASPVNIQDLVCTFEEIKKKYIKNEPKTEEEIKDALNKYPQPKKLKLPKNSDVETVDLLFSDKQRAQLSFLKSLITKVENTVVRDNLLLMFSGLVTKINLTNEPSKGRSEGRGNTSVFQMYRYRIAPHPVDLDVMKYFQLRLNSIIKAKNDIRPYINKSTIDNLKIVKGTATDLKFIDDESIDYIYTDPPYGSKIPYLDLSIMWNAWLDLEVTEDDYKYEAIQGGEHKKTKAEYNALIAESIKEMYRVLKFDRWLSFVFAHKDPEFWHLIINTAEQCGFEYAGAVAQKNGQSSFKKRQNPFTVLSGQLIINFKKVRNPRAIMKAHLGMKVADIVIETIEGVIAKNQEATLEQINNELIIKGLESGFLDLMKKEYSDLTPLLMSNFDYNETKETFTIKKNTNFTSHIDLNLRIEFYLTSYLRRMESEGKKVTFDDIILYVLPLLKNGTTPEKQTILNVLEEIGQKSGDEYWTLKSKNVQLKINFDK